jgi:DNA-binding FadR family transcriptional regulator
MHLEREGSRRRLHQTIARDLEQAIEIGRYPVGSRLPSERDLAEQFEVGRPTVREAFIVLELRGLIETRHGAGVFVKKRPEASGMFEVDSGSGPFEVTEARRLLEGEVAALAARSITDQQIAELEEIMNRIGDMRLDQTAREQADRAFHVALARATENDVLVGMVESLWDLRYRSPLCVYLFRRARQAGIQPPVDEHRVVLDALKRRDADGARQAMRDHLSRVTENLLRATEADALDRARLKVEERRFDFARRAGLRV